MAVEVEISCIRKRPNHTDPHTRIQEVGGVHVNKRWRITEDQAISDILNGKFAFFVRVNGVKVGVMIAQHGNRNYLKTVADGYPPNILLALPECPP